MSKEHAGINKVTIKKTQPIIAVCILIVIAILGNILSKSSGKLTLNLLTGLALGYILTRSRFGFAGGIKRIYVTGEGKLTKALLIMLAISIVATAGIHWGYASVGALPAFRAITPDLSIPGTSSVAVTDIGLIIGAFLFGIGMMIAGGCASGTLSDLGEGAVRSVIVLVFFVLGTAPGIFAKYMISESAIGKISARVYLPDVFGYVGAVAISLFILLILYMITRKYENFRKKEGFYKETVYEENELPLKEEVDFKLLSYKTYHKFFVERWSFLTGGVLLSIMFVFIINTTGSSWGVTAAFGNWSVALLQKFGVHFTSPAFAGTLEVVNKGLIYDPLGWRNIGIIIGAALALLLAGKFKLDYDFKFKDVSIYILGGLLMGFGARLAGGCNIGALYSGIGNFSLSGWVFLVFLSLGGITALKLFEGRINIIPPNRHANVVNKVKEQNLGAK